MQVDICETRISIKENGKFKALRPCAILGHIFRQCVWKVALHLGNWASDCDFFSLPRGQPLQFANLCLLSGIADIKQHLYWLPFILFPEILSTFRYPVITKIVDFWQSTEIRPILYLSLYSVVLVYKEEPLLSWLVMLVPCLVEILDGLGEWSVSELSCRT